MHFFCLDQATSRINVSLDFAGPWSPLEHPNDYQKGGKWHLVGTGADWMEGTSAWTSQILVIKSWREGKITGGSVLEPKRNVMNHKLIYPRLVNTNLNTYLNKVSDRCLSELLFQSKC